MKGKIVILVLLALGLSLAYQNCAPAKRTAGPAGEVAASSSSYTDENGNVVEDDPVNPGSVTTSTTMPVTTTTVRSGVTTTTVKAATTTTVKAVTTTTIKPVTTTTVPAPVSCGIGQERDAALNACISCSSKGMQYSVSSKSCVAQCDGGLVIHIVQWDLTSVANAQTPLGYNILKGFKFKVNGQEKLVGQGDIGSVVPNSGFYNALMSGVANKTGSAAVVAAFAAGVREAGLSNSISVSQGQNFSHTAGAGPNNEMVTVTAQQVVLTGPGVFQGLSWWVYGSSPSKTRHISGMYCK